MGQPISIDRVDEPAIYRNLKIDCASADVDRGISIGCASEMRPEKSQRVVHFS